jgi:AraC-like DNA-binding protein
MARTRGYDGILLDLMLPDVPGLSVLATLRAEKVNTPVLILTGFADLESARVAGRFGASSFRAKPLFVDDLEIAVRQLIQESALGPNNLEAGDAADDELRAGFAVVARLLERLHQLARNSPPIEAGHPSVSEEGSQPFRRVATELIRALTSPALPTIAFLACSAALRKSVTADHAESLHTRAANAEALILAALAKPGLVEPRVVAAIQSLISAAAGHTRPTIELIAEGQGISASHLGRLVRDETGFDVTEWRTALNLRPGLSALVETDHDIKQIACGRLGFKHLSQFDHEFHRFFGLTPTDFRKFKLSHRS